MARSRASLTCRLRGLGAASFLAAAMACAGPAFAQTEVPENWPLKPSGLSAGAQFRLLLVVEAQRDATATSISTYDSFVRAEVAANGHGSIRAFSGNFKVLGSTDAVHARDHTGTNPNSSTGVPIYWLNGLKLADDNADFYDGTWPNKSAGRFEDGTTLNNNERGDRIATGSQNSGARNNNNPLGGNGDGTGNVQTSRLAAANQTLNNGNRPATDNYRFFALSSVFEVGSDSNASVTDLSITSTTGSADEYVAGDTLQFTATFSEAVTVTGTPQLNFIINDFSSNLSETRQAGYVSADSTATELVFSYTVTTADFDNDGVAVPAGAIDLNGGSIVTQSSSTDADMASSAITDRANHKIHIRPMATSASVVSNPADVDDGYVTGENIRMGVTFDRKVRVITTATGTPGTQAYISGGTPTLEILFDSPSADAAYSGADGDYMVHFDHVVRPGDYDEAGLSTMAYAIDFNNGAISRKEVADSVAKFGNYIQNLPTAAISSRIVSTV